MSISFFSHIFDNIRPSMWIFDELNRLASENEYLSNELAIKREEMVIYKW